MPELKTVKEYSNYRVVVDVAPRHWLVKNVTSKDALDDTRSAAEDIITSIKRHVDGGESAYFDFDATEVCAYCGAEMSGAVSLVPEDGLPVGVPLCCGKAQDEWLEAWQEEERLCCETEEDVEAEEHVAVRSDEEFPFNDD